MPVSKDKMIEAINKVDPSKLTFLHPECVDNFSAIKSEDLLQLFPNTLNWLNDHNLLTTENITALYLRWGNFFKDNFSQIEAIDAAYNDFKNHSNGTPDTNFKIDQQKLFNFLVTLVRPELTARFLLKAQAVNALNQDFFDNLAARFTPMTNEKLKLLHTMQESVFIAPDDYELALKLRAIKQDLDSPRIIAPGSFGIHAARTSTNPADNNAKTSLKL